MLRILLSYLLGFLFFFAFQGCEQKNYTAAIIQSLEEAGDNADEIKTILSHYEKHQADSLKYQAAVFLIENMYMHQTILDSAYNSYSAAIMRQKMPIATPDLDSLWDKTHKPHKVKDLHVIKATAIIQNIEESFAIRDQSKWKDSIDFNTFLHYILPYKVDNESFRPEWRKVLHDQYAHLIQNVTDPKIAFAFIKMFLRSKSQTREAKSNFSESLDPLTMDYLRRGSCAQLDMYTIAILRALHIPASFDYIESWGNYSQVGHSWSAYAIFPDETYTLDDKDSVVRKYNRIDASYFKEHADPPKYLLHISRHKTVYKIYRKGYSLSPGNRKNLSKRDEHKFDVSHQYGLDGSIVIPLHVDIVKAGLAVFHTGSGWKEFALSAKIGNKVTFNNVGKNVMYLMTQYDTLGLSHAGIPFYVTDNGEPRYFEPDSTKEKTVLLRKYPLFGNWPAQWQRMIGGKLEASKSVDFSSSTKTIYEISSTPYGNITIPLKNLDAYTAIRYICPEGSRTPISEFTLLTENGMQITGGIPIAHKLDKKVIHLAFDGDIMTNPSTKKEGYWIGLDLTPIKKNLKDVVKIEIVPKQDGNFITKGDIYELYYFDRKWVKTYAGIATSDYLEVDQLPQGAVYWLRNKTKGVEERIFTLENGQQVWW